MNKDNKTPIQVDGFEMLEKTVMAQGTSGRVYLPVSWIGKRVKIVRIE